MLAKQVPDTSSGRRFEGSRLVRGEDDVLNEFDENAVEAAAELVAAHGGRKMPVTHWFVVLLSAPIALTSFQTPCLKTLMSQ